MTPAALIARAREFGYAIELTAAGPQLVPVVKGSLLTTAFRADLAKHREALVAYLTACRLCGRPAGSAEDRERLKTVNPWCDDSQCPYRKRG